MSRQKLKPKHIVFMIGAVLIVLSLLAASFFVARGFGVKNAWGVAMFFFMVAVNFIYLVRCIYESMLKNQPSSHEMACVLEEKPKE